MSDDPEYAYLTTRGRRTRQPHPFESGEASLIAVAMTIGVRLD